MEKHKIKIQVAVRIRPFLQFELKQGASNQKIQIHHPKKQIHVHDQHKNLKIFKFDKIIDPTFQQQQVFQIMAIQQMLKNVILGFHFTIIAYGQTGSGKTFTMQGQQNYINEVKTNSKVKELNCPNNSGIIPRTIYNLFQLIKDNKRRVFKISCSFLQIYCERIYDLLNKGYLIGNSLRLRWNKNDQFVVQNLFVYQCRTAQELIKFWIQGIKNRIVGTHKLNYSSSRSHTILSIKVQSYDLLNQDLITFSKIDLVDLAGSQRISHTGFLLSLGSEGKTAKESIEINKSLFILKQVINSLCQINNGRKDHIPYRESKLTSILKQSIGGNSYCMFIACLRPSDKFIGENVNTLSYATKALTILNKPQRNQDPRAKQIVNYKFENQTLRQELQKANKHIQMTQNLQNKTNNIAQNKFQNVPERLIQSINMVRDLLKSNKQLRQSIDQWKNKYLTLQHDYQLLLKQNQQLRESKENQDFQIPFQQINQDTTPSFLRKNKNMFSTFEDKMMRVFSLTSNQYQMTNFCRYTLYQNIKQDQELSMREQSKKSDNINFVNKLNYISLSNNNY